MKLNSLLKLCFSVTWLPNVWVCGIVSVCGIESDIKVVQVLYVDTYSEAHGQKVRFSFPELPR